MTGGGTVLAATWHCTPCVPHQADFARADCLCGQGSAVTGDVDDIPKHQPQLASHKTGREPGDDQAWLRRFEYWKQCETVAMHFNDLLSGLRLKAIGGLAVAGAVLGNNGDKASFSVDEYKAIASGLCLLVALWMAVAALDLLYYSALLRGAVDELERVEELLSDVRMSLAIETRVLLGERLAWSGESPDANQIMRKRSRERGPRHVYEFFYVVPFLALCILMALCFHLANAMWLRWIVPLVFVVLAASARFCLGSRGRPS